MIFHLLCINSEWWISCVFFFLYLLLCILWHFTYCIFKFVWLVWISSVSFLLNISKHDKVHSLFSEAQLHTPCHHIWLVKKRMYSSYMAYGQFYTIKVLQPFLHVGLRFTFSLGIFFLAQPSQIIGYLGQISSWAWKKRKGSSVSFNATQITALICRTGPDEHLWSK